MELAVSNNWAMLQLSQGLLAAGRSGGIISSAQWAAETMFNGLEDSTATLVSALANEPYAVTSETAIKFQRLRDQWRKERPLHTSSVAKLAMSAPYQEIIGLGPKAIGLILNELKTQSEPEHWFWALAAISGHNPVPAESRGKTRQMAEAWLSWGREHGYIQ